MARIAGVDLPKNKRLDIALTYIFGVGRTTALKVLDTVGIDWTIKTDDLSGDQVNTIRKELEDNYKVEGDLRRDQIADIKRLMDIGSYRGLRHRRGLPVRGQSSKTNARTRKGPRRSVMSRKKK
ncbi:30S ribosomal protein S13 [Maridesulfovibrio zosterae]|uniref:30S ribosomal protein S13 n=1 Tax=Maridesulfovibrio zosterae TaxID=82171 RepID=UPI00047FDE46|nr:30S ribosomal protein S13 [Maridesulfovibrio zosterae]